MQDFLRKVFGNSNEREIMRLMKKVERINALEPDMKKLTDAELTGKTDEFKKRLADGATLDDLLEEAFAAVREASVRINGQRPFDVQLIGGIVLHQGRISEMKTGEGKTLVATMPAYLNALEGKGAHIVTVNDYLAKFHSEWMGRIYRFMGLEVGLIVHDLDNVLRKQAYAADITYGTNNELGFDYLRDNMVVRKEDMVQRGLHFAIVDEVDSILIDEARTPLIISGEGDKSTDMYVRADRFSSRLQQADYALDEKAHAVNLSEIGVDKAERYFGIENLSDTENTELHHYINQALKARILMKRDKDYIVKDGQVIIIDEFTGRQMIGRRYSDGLHQAIEAKEGVKVERESKTLATITFQNYFRMYKKLSGMTGTAKTEEEEFKGIYNLDVVVIPTNKPMIRRDNNDVIYRTERGKFNAVVEEVTQLYETGQPVLVGTVSVEKSEILSDMLSQRGVPHQVLNAKFHEREAEIVAQAGKLNTVTIATNMAGRGTDILLGGNPDFMARAVLRKEGVEEHVVMEATGHGETDDEAVLAARKRYNELYQDFRRETDRAHDHVVDKGGLHIIGTERHESRRIDNQLRGRSGRQGDPGSSRFYVSLEDDLMRLFGSDRVQGIVSAIGMTEDMQLEYGMLSRQIENAQKKVESRNYQTRKHVLEYDDVMNTQRELIYTQRRRVLEGDDVHAMIVDMMNAFVDRLIATYTSISPDKPEEWDLEGLLAAAERVFLPQGAIAYTEDEIYGLNTETLKERLIEEFTKAYGAKTKQLADAGIDVNEIERAVVLRAVDRRWMDHIDAMDQLRQGVGLRAYGQRDPVIEYKFEGFDMFEEMVQGIQEDALTLMLHINVQKAPPERRVAPAQHLREGRGSDGNAQAPAKKAPVKTDKIVGRNDPCPCGSGKKYKNCCGANN
jgi:preprotein translocase subunit SecA